MSVGGVHSMIKNLPTKLKKLRISNNLSQKDVLQKPNVSLSIIHGYKTGERTPKLILDTEGLTTEQIHALSTSPIFF